MSAGICIMNKQAIALAADSAVTIGDHVAIHNSANKLFSLSRSAPVGMIIYANATFMSVPVEIIAKQYKKYIKDTTFPKLEDYVYDFIKYIESNNSLFIFNINENDYVRNLFIDFIRGLLGDYEQIVKQKEEIKREKLTEKEKVEAANIAVKSTIEFADSFQKIDGHHFYEYVKKTYFNDFVNIINENKELAWLSDKQIKSVCNSACKLFDTEFDRNGYVGVAIAGYGEEEIYPRMIHLHFEGYVNGKVRYYVQEQAKISEDVLGSIVPLAQTDVMQTFLFGINDGFLNDLSMEIPKQIDEVMNHIDNKYFASGKKEIVKRQLNGVTGKIIEHMADIASRNYMLPIIQSVSTLPIEELALLAESMINITSLRRKVALDRNIGTVGGPIDVAIITKGDGLIWLKRKHYFDPKYNPQYFYSHFDKIDKGETYDE